MRTPILVASRPDTDPSRATPRGALDSILFYGLCGLLLFGPLAFGAVESWSIFVLEAGAAVLFILWVFRQGLQGELQVTANPLFPPLLTVAALALLQLALGRSAYRYNTVSGLLLYCAYGALCFLAVQCLRKTSQLRTLAVIFSAYGCALATFALVQEFTSNGKLYWLRTPRFGGWIYGPYVNHNHYAGLMEMLFPIPLALCLSRFVRGGQKAMLAFAAVLMAGTIFLSGSRGGMLAFAAQVALLILVLATRHKGPRTAPGIALFLVLITGLLVWMGGTELAQRLASIRGETHTELSGGVRLAIDRDGLKMFARRPLLGWGLGVFPVAYPQFRSFYTNFFVNQAHNDYLQLLVEMGALGFAAMLWFLFLLYRCGLRKLQHWTTEVHGTVTLAALLGCTGILVHSFVDFNLQIPANAALFYVLCVVAASEPRGQSAHARAPAPGA